MKRTYNGAKISRFRAHSKEILFKPKDFDREVTVFEYNQ